MDKENFRQVAINGIRQALAGREAKMSELDRETQTWPIENRQRRLGLEEQHFAALELMRLQLLNLTLKDYQGSGWPRDGNAFIVRNLLIPNVPDEIWFMLSMNPARFLFQYQKFEAIIGAHPLLNVPGASKLEIGQKLAVTGAHDHLLQEYEVIGIH